MKPRENVHFQNFVEFFYSEWILIGVCPYVYKILFPFAVNSGMVSSTLTASVAVTASRGNKSIIYTDCTYYRWSPVWLVIVLEGETVHLYLEFCTKIASADYSDVYWLFDSLIIARTRCESPLRTLLGRIWSDMGRKRNCSSYLYQL